MLKVIAFDCDGVMFDTRRANREYYNQLLANFGRPPMTAAQLDFVHINTVGKSVAHIFEPGDIDAVNRYRKQLGYLPFIKYMEIEPDLKALLAGLRKK